MNVTPIDLGQILLETDRLNAPKTCQYVAQLIQRWDSNQQAIFWVLIITMCGILLMTYAHHRRTEKLLQQKKE